MGEQTLNHYNYHIVRGNIPYYIVLNPNKSAIYRYLYNSCECYLDLYEYNYNDTDFCFWCAIFSGLK